MEEGQVEVIKKVEGPVIRDRRLVGKPLTITRKRVAAYVRVSTNAEEQLQSFKSQKEYYQDKISANKEWALVGIYADEGITGTKTTKRDEFLRMIDDCMNGLVDIVITKSVSRFSRNLVDVLSYTRMLKAKGVTVIFEKENIDTSTMESEMQLSLLSALAQNEVEALSQNVTLGVQMKMSRGELMGFNGCLGYDYHPEDKSITINEKEAETVRMIFDLYVQGYGAYTIAKELTRLGKVNKKGEVKWTDSGIRGILKNEKYKGDLLMGKTYTVDPISKRRLDNRGESNKYYTRKKYGTRHRRFVRADIVPMRMCPMEQEPSSQESTHSAVCVSVVSVERILQGVPIIRIHSIKSLYGNAGRQPIKELKTVRTARQLMRLS